MDPIPIVLATAAYTLIMVRSAFVFRRAAKEAGRYVNPVELGLLGLAWPVLILVVGTVAVLFGEVGVYRDKPR
jgi:hypothetical protein